MADSNGQIVIIGAGPAGLAAAYELVQHGLAPTVLEQGSRIGGLARTERLDSFGFDIGGHRFFTKNQQIDRLWRQLGDVDYREVNRLSRIYYRNKFFRYPLEPLDTMRTLGLTESMLVLGSFARAQIMPLKSEETFEKWVVNRFGRRLYEAFFKSYTEKVWGISCRELCADWAAQRIRDLSMGSIIRNTLFRRSTPKSLIRTFCYPRFGSGSLWERFAEGIRDGGGQLMLNSEVVRIHCTADQVCKVSYKKNDSLQTMPVSHLISSMPVKHLITLMNDPPPEFVLRAVNRLRHRAFMIIALLLENRHLFPDQWIYIHSERVRMLRLQNFRNWSPDLIPDADKTLLGLEYFCNTDDELWLRNDNALLDMAAEELQSLGLAEERQVLNGCIIREPYAYPLYDSGYRQDLAVVRDYLNMLTNVQTVGRGGLHRYNNMDQATVAGIRAAANVCGGSYDLWSDDADNEYLEAQ